MAEGVERAMGFMTEEFQEMKRVIMFSDKQISKIKEKRRKFEYKIRGIPKNIEDFKSYIQFENDLLTLMHHRRNKFKVSERKGSLEYSIINRIKKLYEETLLYFSHNYEVCVEYFKFCKSKNYVNPATAAIDRIIRHHSGNEKAWQLAATWHAEGRKDYKTALEYLVKGLALHKDSKLLYKEAIMLELVQIKESLDESILEEKQRMCCVKIKDYIAAVFTNISDYSYYLELVQLLDKHTFTCSVTNSIMDKLKSEYSTHPIVWHSLAQREYTAGANKEECLTVYLEGFKIVDSQDGKIELWSMFLDFVVQLYSLKKCDLTFLNYYMNFAHNGGYLLEKYYYTWLELNCDSEALDILFKGTQKYPTSVKLWKLLLHYKLLKDCSVDDITETFEKGVTNLKEKALPLWTAFIRYQILYSEDKVEQLYERGVKEPAEVSNVLKPQFLEWSVVAKGISETRKVYDELSIKEPFCKELHTCMSNLEAVENDNERREKIHKLACRQFPNDVDVWVNYMEFVNLYLKDKKKLSTVYYQAVTMLSDLRLLHFKEKYSMFV